MYIDTLKVWCFTSGVKSFFKNFSHDQLQFVVANTLLPVGVTLLFRVLRDFGMPWQFQSALAIAFVVFLFVLNVYFWRRLKGWRLGISILMFLNIFALFIIGDISFFTAIPALITLVIPSYIELYNQSLD